MTKFTLDWFDNFNSAMAFYTVGKNSFPGGFPVLALLRVVWPPSARAWLFLRALERARERGQVSEADFYAEQEKLLRWRGG